MNKLSMYDQFSQDYDRFVDWDARLSVEIPFLVRELDTLKKNPEQVISVLDSACGTGQHVIELAARGFDCTGADNSLEMMNIARQNADKGGHSIQFMQAGFGQLQDVFPGHKYDSLICLGNSLPHVLDSQMLLNALQDFHAILQPGGKLILQNRNFDKVMAERKRWMPPQTHREADKTWIFNRFYDFDPDGLITFNIQILFSSGRSDFSQQIINTRLWPITESILIEHLQKASFKDLIFFGDLEGTQFDRATSENLVIIAYA